MSNNFCVHPWNGLDIKADGELTPCYKIKTNLLKNYVPWLDENNSSHFDLFKQITKQHDLYRKEQFRTTFPELSELLGDVI